MVSLQELCDFHNGLWTGKKPPFVTARVVRNTNFTSDGRIDLSDVAVLDVEERHLAKRELRQNDIIIEKSGGGPKQPVGRVVLFELEETGYSFSNFTSVIRVKPDALLDPVYLHRVLYWWYLCGVTESLQRRSTGIRNLDFNAYKSLEVPLPPLEEQQRIVAILDQAFAALDRARDCTEANLADVVEVRDAILSSAIERATAETAEPVALGVLCKIARGGSPRPIKKFLTTDEDGINWIKISDATASGKFIDSTKERIIQEGVSKSRFVTPGSFLLTNSMSFGRPYILRTDGCIHDGWLVLEPDYDKVDQDYLYHLLGSKQIFREFDRLAAGSTVRNLNINLVSSVVVRLPPLEKQREAVELIESGVEQCAKLAEHYRLQLEDIATLRQSLLQQAFSGQLT